MARPKREKPNGAPVLGPRAVVLGREERRLPVPVAASEVDHALRAMAQTTAAIWRLAAERRAAVADFKKRLAAMEKEMLELSDTVTTGTALAPVWCRKTLDVDAGLVDLHREDTGALVETRPATPADRQTRLVEVATIPVEKTDTDGPLIPAALERGSERGGEVPRVEWSDAVPAGVGTAQTRLVEVAAIAVSFERPPERTIEPDEALYEAGFPDEDMPYPVEDYEVGDSNDENDDENDSRQDGPL
jgi:hypothetical protein